MKIKKLLFGIVVGGLLLASIGLGTHAWFTSETNATGQMQSGTLEINGGEDIEEPMFDGENFTPSQLEYGNWVTISNTGDLDTLLKATYTHNVDRASLEKFEVGYMAMKYIATPGEDAYEDSEIALENLFDGTTNERGNSPASLHENIEFSGKLLTEDEVESGEILFGEGDEDDFWQLDEGQYIDIMVAIKLDESAGNEYQGIIYEADLNVKAKQTDDGAQYE